MKLIIDIDNNDYELINKTGVTLDLNTVFHGKEKDKEMTFAIFDLVKALKNGIPYEERPQGDLISRDALIKAVDDLYEYAELDEVLDVIKNAPIVDLWEMRQEATENALKKAEVMYKRPQGEVTDCENCQFKKFSKDLADKLAKVMADNGITDFDEFAKACGISYLHQDSITKSDTEI